MKTIYPKYRHWGIIFFLFIGFPLTGLAQTELYETVIEKTDGTEMCYLITPEYPIISGSSVMEDDGLAHHYIYVETEVKHDLIPYTEIKKIYARLAQITPVTITAKSYTRKYGEYNPSFEYTSEGEELEGTPEITCEATLTSPVGTYPIVITKGSVSNYAPTFVDGVLTVEAAPLTIVAKDYMIKQGEELPNFEVDYYGFQNGETTDILTKLPVATTTATSASEPGTYDIIVSGAEAPNYEMVYQKGRLVIIDADPATVIANSYTREYGEANPTFEYTCNGAELVGTPEITCEAIETSPVGNYPIVVTKGTITNYNVTYIDGSLYVNPAPLTITAKSYTIKQGDELPTLEAIYSGWKNDETDDVLITKPTIVTLATSNSSPGTYPIYIYNAEAQNYYLSYVNGTLTIEEANPVTVIANSYTREYGEANPTFEYTSEGAELVGTPVITCEATVISPVGTYPIVISKGSVINENDTYVNGVLTIEEAPLMVSVENATREQGKANPAFVLNYSGWKNGENESVLIVKPTATTEATIDSPAGEYAIVLSGGQALNYELSYTNGILTVTEASGIVALSAEHPADVYDTLGNKVRNNATSLKGLAKGVYIVNGNKVVVK
ncbi:hypothetical protein SAMN02910409_0720 [Prevotellaceae bacterium HUN156]|nr:hypothetical protein SAMN02910409_0720 [Prevotellaceae bacterium HUN156]